MASLAPGAAFPRLSLQDESGRDAAPPEGETLYAFFKTTCPTCEFSWPFLERIRRSGGGLRIVGVSQDPPEEAREFAARLDTRLPTLYDTRSWETSDRLGITHVPTFFRVGADGALRGTVVGFDRAAVEGFADESARLAGREPAPLFRPDENVPAMKPG